MVEYNIDTQQNSTQSLIFNYILLFIKFLNIHLFNMFNPHCQSRFKMSSTLK